MYCKQDYMQLQRIYNQTSNDIVLIYGNERCGISDLVSAFIKDKRYLYYKAQNIDYYTQIKLFIKELNNQRILPRITTNNLDEAIYTYLSKDTSSKRIIVIDDFTSILASNTTFINYIKNLVSLDSIKGSLLVILMTKDIAYIESIINSNNSILYEISDVIKINNYDYNEICNIYSSLNRYTRFALFSCLGGNTRYWAKVHKTEEFKQYITTHLLNSNDILFYEGNKILPEKIRNTTIYNSILYSIANGYEKISELSQNLNIDKAKLLVYIKALINYDILYKPVSIPVINNKLQKKGVYKIRDPYVKFYYYFIFPNISALTYLSTERYYRRFIEPDLIGYMNYYYPICCQRNLRLYFNDNSRGITIKNTYDFEDKNDLIDFIATGVNEEILICSCDFSLNQMTYQLYEKLKNHLTKNKIKYDYIVLFSYTGFDNTLINESKIDDKLLLLKENYN